MKPSLTAAGVVFAVLVQAGTPARAQDEVRYLDREKKAEVTLPGTIQEESPTQILIKLSSGRSEKVPVADLVEITYQPPAGLNRLDYRRPTNREDEARRLTADGRDAGKRKKAVEEAIASYKELIPKLKARPPAQRHMQFRLAQFLAWEAENDPARADTAVQALQQFQKDHPDSWQIGTSMKTLARLLESRGDVAGAQKVYETLASRADVPRELRQEFELLLVRTLLDNDKHAAAEARLKDLGKGLSSTDPQALRIQVYLADCEAALRKPETAEKQLQEVIARASDPQVKALAYNTLGDVYRRKATPQALEEALWKYLWVDVLYSQDRVEHARALYHLSRLFEQVRKDDLRAAQCAERLKDKRFDGVEYQKRALKKAETSEKP